MSRRRNVHLQLWLTTEESGRLQDTAHQWGYKTTEEFVRSGIGKQGRLTEEFRSIEKRQAATLTAMRTEIARLQCAEYVIFAMLENLAKTILTYRPIPAAYNKSAAIALGMAAYERYLWAVGTSLNNGSKTTLETLTGLDS